MNAVDVFSRSLRLGGVLTAVLLVVAGVLGWLLGGGMPGLLGAIVAVVASAVLLGVTTVSVLVGNRMSQRRGDTTIFFAVVAGAWLVKLVLFLVLVLSLRSAHWMNPSVFGIVLVIAVVGQLVVDVLVLARSRITVVPLPESGPPSGPDDPGVGA